METFARMAGDVALFEQQRILTDRILADQGHHESTPSNGADRAAANVEPAFEFVGR